MCSEGGEYDVEKSSRDKTQQREQLNKQFGFDKLGLQSELFIDDEDLNDEAATEEKKSAKDILKEEIKNITNKDENLSAREVNRLKRKAKMDARASKKAEEEAENEPKKIKLDPDIDTDHVEKVTDLENSLVWPLSSFYDQLVTDLMSGNTVFSLVDTTPY